MKIVFSALKRRGMNANEVRRGLANIQAKNKKPAGLASMRVSGLLLAETSGIARPSASSSRLLGPACGCRYGLRFAQTFTEPLTRV